jgi:hypothetical protein
MRTHHLTPLLVFAPVHNARKVALIVASFTSALLIEAAGWRCSSPVGQDTSRKAFSRIRHAHHVPIT